MMAKPVYFRLVILCFCVFISCKERKEVSEIDRQIKEHFDVKSLKSGKKKRKPPKSSAKKASPSGSQKKGGDYARRQ